MIITSSLSQGNNTVASGNCSHAEGSNTEAKGTYSHAEGESTLALGRGSHAGGLRTIALDDYQTVFGQYNKDNNPDDYFVVGIGTQLSREDGFGLNKTRTYVSNSLLLPNLTQDSKVEILTYNTSTKQVHYSPLSELSVEKANYATRALTSSFSNYTKQATLSFTSSYSEQAKNAIQALSASFTPNAQQSLTASYIECAQTAITASYIHSAPHAITASYIRSAPHAVTASFINDSTVVKTINDVLKLKPVTELPWFIDSGALALYKGELYFCTGMAGWRKVMLSDEIISIPPPKRK